MTKQKNNKNNTKSDSPIKRWFIIGGLTVAVVGGIVMVTNKPKDNTPTKPKVEQTKPKKKKTIKQVEDVETESSSTNESSSTSSSEIPVDNYEKQAEASLERADELASDQDTQVVKDAVTHAVDSTIAMDTVKPDFNAGTQPSDIYPLQTLKTLSGLGYTLSQDSIKVVRSNSDHVLQFTANMVKDDKIVAFTGNYMVGSKQIQFQKVYGDMSSFAAD